MCKDKVFLLIIPHEAENYYVNILHIPSKCLENYKKCRFKCLENYKNRSFKCLENYKIQPLCLCISKIFLTFAHHIIHMIPRIIHYCWFGGKEMPEREKSLISEWRRIMPDYEMMRWDESNFPLSLCDYSRESWLMGDYAFTSDVARLYALAAHGGIYLDTDIQTVGTFDPFLNLDSFIGLEGELLGTGVIGARPGCSWIKKFLEYYKNHHYIDTFGHPRRTPNTKILTRDIMPALSLNEKPEVFPADVFCAKDFLTGKITVTPATVTIHHFAASWRRPRSLYSRIMTIMKGLRVRYGQLPIPGATK